MKLSVVIFALISSTCGAQQQQVDWVTVAIPDAFRSVPKGKLAPIDGYSWYRCTVDIPAAWKSDKVTLHVEALDDARAAYVNGMKVGATGTFPPIYRSGLGESGRYQVPSNILKSGATNSIAIKVYQNDPRPNFSVAPPALINETKQQGIRLNGQWQYRPGKQAADSFALSGNVESSDVAIPFSTVDEVQNIRRYVTQREGDHAPLPPEVAVSQFEVPSDLEMSLVLSEPEIAQPLFMTWDSSGRLWVMEYRQYPEVAGVRMLSRDVYLRSVYDKVPEPPPYGAKGRDRISIHEDVDGDGVYETHKTFVDGLNIATSFAIGRGGVFVTNPPYLLFYPDRNADDVPDGDPEVLLEGFGLEDSHSVINSLRFGPDGWLYGCQGSTVTARIKRPGSSETPIQTMGQQIWRYHPETRKFEVFAEGGGNTFGCEIDSKGNVFSGHNGGDTRGFHYVQGGYYKKGFGKHGPLSNPYAFGYFPSMKHAQVPRFTHNFVIYEDGGLPDRYRGRLFGIEPLQGQVVLSDIRPHQSSFQTEDISRVVKTQDQWFRPVDIKVGPDQAIYIADMYEQRIDHSSHYAGRIDRKSGRIYRLHAKPPPSENGYVKTDWAERSTEELVRALKSEGRTDRQTIIRLLGDRRDAKETPALVQMLRSSQGQIALESLWALHACGQLHPDIAVEMLDHKTPDVRAWTIRLMCDAGLVLPEFAEELIATSANEMDIHVRKQMASSAKRLPAKVALPLIRNLLLYDEDSTDIHQPQLLWWALESKVELHSDAIIETLFSDQHVWACEIVNQHIAERLMKRYALSGTRKDLLLAARLLNASTHKPATVKLLSGFEDAYTGRSLTRLPDELVAALAEAGGGSLALRVRQGQAGAISEAITSIEDANTADEQRIQLVQIFGQIDHPEVVEPLLRMIESNSNSRNLQAAAIVSLQSYSDSRIANLISRRLQSLSGEVRQAAEALLAGRVASSLVLLAMVEEGQIPKSSISASTVMQMLLHDNDAINRLVNKHWGTVIGANVNDVAQRINELQIVLGDGSGNPKKGKPLFMKQCGQCHTLFGEGGQIGPDLTSFKRDNSERMLSNIVNPSLEIREGFENHVVVTNEGRVITGLLADKDQRVTIVRGVDGQNVVVSQSDIEETFISKTSLMPEGTLKGLTDQQVRDLFAYFRSSQPVNY